MFAIDFLLAFSLVASIVSVVLAIVAILFAKSVERDTRTNFDKTQRIMNEQHEKTKDVLSEIDKRAAVIEKTVLDSQERLLGTLTNIVNETVIPKKQDVSEQMGIMLMQKFLEDPSSAASMMEIMQGFSDQNQVEPTEHSN